MKYFVNRTILIISPEHWDHIPVSKHHYASTLAALGNKVFFLNPPSEKNQLSAVADEKNICVIDYKTIRGINRMPGFVRNLVNARMIGKIKALCHTEFDIVWSFDSFRFQNLSLWKAPVKIYHVVDVHIAPLESELCSSADMILSVSDLIYERFDQYNKIKAKINHGLAPWFLDPPPAVSLNGNLLKEGGRKKVGYVGNLDNWCLDKATLLQIISNSPDSDFYFIGPYKKDSELMKKLSEFKNTMIVGKVASKELPGWFEQMDLFLMCYQGADTVVNSNHHKIIEFLSTGKPAVINFTDDYKDKRDLVIMSDKNEELPRLFRQVSNNLSAYSQPQMVSRRKEFASENSYWSQVRRIDSLIEPLLRA